LWRSYGKMIEVMQVFITGSSGFIGTKLRERLTSRGDGIIAWRRNTPFDDVAKADAVVNLAGEPIVGRWSEAKKRAIVASRVDLTKSLVDAIGRASTKPKVLVNASAVGFYGDSGEAILDETSPEGHDFLADVCRDWEQAALGAEAHGLRVVRIRTGVVLGRGGALEKMLPAFKMGAGGKIGSGEQYMSWIHLDDLVSMYVNAIDDDRWRGAFNGTAPAPVTNKELTKTLGEVLHRPSVMTVPSFALKVVFGEGGSVMTTGQRVVPKRAKELGFAHRYTDLREALTEILR
jgi:uncharacterized protein